MIQTRVTGGLHVSQKLSLIATSNGQTRSVVCDKVARLKLVMVRLSGGYSVTYEITESKDSNSYHRSYLLSLILNVDDREHLSVKQSILKSVQT